MISRTYDMMDVFADCIRKLEAITLSVSRKYYRNIANLLIGPYMISYFEDSDGIEEFAVYSENIDLLTKPLTYEEKYNLFKLACEWGKLKSLKSLTEKFGLPIRDKFIQFEIKDETTVCVRRVAGDERDLDDFLGAACKHGHPKIVKYLFEQGAKDVEGATEKAFDGRHLEILDYLLLNHKADVHWIFVNAVAFEEREIVEHLLLNAEKYKLDIHYNYDDALRLAAYENKFEMVKLLVDNGADIHANEDEVLRDSIYCGNMEMFDYFLSKGIDVKTNITIILMAAMRGKNKEVLNHLLNADLDLTSEDKSF